MRTLSMTSAAFLGLYAASAAFAQPAVRPGHVPGEGTSYPLSDQSSNINPSDTRSMIAPTLPTPAGDTTDQLLREARRALSQRQTGRAQEALERAETRLLDRSTPQGATDQPARDPRVDAIAQARQALGHRDVAGAQRLIDQALALHAAAPPGAGAMMDARPRRSPPMRGDLRPSDYPPGAPPMSAGPMVGGAAVNPPVASSAVTGGSTTPGPGNPLGVPLGTASQQGTATTPGNAAGGAR